MKRHFIPIGIFVVAVCIPFGSGLIGQSALWGLDWVSYFHPCFHLFQKQWQNWKFVWWNHLNGLGYPQFAEGQLMQLYPPTLILVKLFPSWWAMTIFVAVHFLLSAVGTYLFCLQNKLPKSSATLAGCVFAFSGFMFGHYAHLSVIATVAWMPTVLLFLERGIMTDRIPQNFALSGIVLALQLIVGQAQFVFYTFLLAVSYILFRLWEDKRGFKALKRVIFGLFLMMALGLTLSAPQWIETYQLHQLSLRKALPPSIFAVGYGLPPENLLTFFLPHLFGTINGYLGRSLFWETSGYVTFLPFLITAAVLFLRPRCYTVWFWVFVAISGLILCIVDNNPLYAILPNIPVFNWFRVPARYLVLVTFALAMLTAYGHSVILNANEKTAIRRSLKCFLVISLFTIITVIAANFIFCGGQHVLFWLMKGNLANSFFRQNRTLSDTIFNSLAGWDSLLLFLHASLGSLSIVGMMVSKIRPHFTTAFLLVLLLTDLLRFGIGMRQIIDPIYFSYKPSTEKFLNGQKGLFRIWSWKTDEKVARRSKQMRNLPASFIQKSFLPSNLNIFSDTENIESFVALEQLRPFNLTKIIFLPSDGEFLSAIDEKSKIPFILHGVDWTIRTKLLSLLNVRFIVTTEKIDDSNWSLVFDEGVKIWENKAVMPRAFLVGAVIHQSPYSVLKTLTSPNFDHKRVAIVETNQVLSLPTEPPSDFLGDALIKLYEGDKIIIETESNANAVLVVSNAYYPNWVAWVDEKQKPILITNYALMGVEVPKGRHTVTFRFRRFRYLNM